MNIVNWIKNVIVLFYLSRKWDDEIKNCHEVKDWKCMELCKLY